MEEYGYHVCSIEELVARYRSGDESALDELMRVCGKLLFAYFYARIESYEDAEDYTQEVLIRIWRKLETIPEEGKFTPFLYTVARNLLIDMYRNALRGIQTFPILDDPDEGAGVTSDGIVDRFLLPDEIAILKDIVSKIEAAINSDELTQTRREHIYAHYRNGKSCQEIAEEHGIKGSSVKQSLQHAREKLRRILVCTYPEIHVAKALKVHFCVLGLIQEVSENERT